ncbi:hypothetical protein MMPV_004684 [Pyropia vietnamensis]
MASLSESPPSKLSPSPHPPSAACRPADGLSLLVDGGGAWAPPRRVAVSAVDAPPRRVVAPAHGTQRDYGDEEEGGGTAAVEDLPSTGALATDGPAAAAGVRGPIAPPRRMLPVVTTGNGGGGSPVRDGGGTSPSSATAGAGHAGRGAPRLAGAGGPSAGHDATTPGGRSTLTPPAGRAATPEGRATRGGGWGGGPPLAVDSRSPASARARRSPAIDVRRRERTPPRLAGSLPAESPAAAATTSPSPAAVSPTHPALPAARAEVARLAAVAAARAVEADRLRAARVASDERLAALIVDATAQAAAAEADATEAAAAAAAADAAMAAVVAAQDGLGGGLGMGGTAPNIATKGRHGREDGCGSPRLRPRLGMMGHADVAVGAAAADGFAPATGVGRGGGGSPGSPPAGSPTGSPAVASTVVGEDLDAATRVGALRRALVCAVHLRSGCGDGGIGGRGAVLSGGGCAGVRAAWLRLFPSTGGVGPTTDAAPAAGGRLRGRSGGVGGSDGDGSVGSSSSLRRQGGEEDLAALGSYGRIAAATVAAAVAVTAAAAVAKLPVVGAAAGGAVG